MAVLIVGARPMRSKKGARWAIFTIQDMTGIQELLAFPESFARFETMLKPGSPLLLKVRVQVEEAGTRLSLQEARKIEDMVERATAQEFRVRLNVQALREETLDGLEKLFESAPGMTQVIFELVSPDGSVATMASQQRVKVTPELTEAVHKIKSEQAAA